jgi:RNA polymerase sigma-70 factor, ECF subfamily
MGKLKHIDTNVPVVEQRLLFDDFLRAHSVRFTDAVVAKFGFDVGCDVASAAFVHAWEHWTKVSVMDNPLGYLFRVAQSSARPHHRWLNRWVSAFPAATLNSATTDSYSDPDLAEAMTKIPSRQRVCLLLLYAHGWSQREVADLLEVSEAVVNNEAHRGRKRLRALLKE